MVFTTAEHEAITGHAAALGLSTDEYIQRTAADRALAWKREQDAFYAMAQHRGCTVEELIRRGCLTDSSPDRP